MCAIAVEFAVAVVFVSSVVIVFEFAFAGFDFSSDVVEFSFGFLGFVTLACTGEVFEILLEFFGVRMEFAKFGMGAVAFDIAFTMFAVTFAPVFAFSAFSAMFASVFVLGPAFAITILFRDDVGGECECRDCGEDVESQ